MNFILCLSPPHYRKSNQILAEEYHFTPQKNKWRKTPYRRQLCFQMTSALKATVLNQVVGLFLQLNIMFPLLTSMSRRLVRCKADQSAHQFLTKRQADAQRPCFCDSDRVPPASCKCEERRESKNTKTSVGFDRQIQDKGEADEEPRNKKKWYNGSIK